MSYVWVGLQEDLVAVVSRHQKRLQGEFADWRECSNTLAMRAKEFLQPLLFLTGKSDE
ncbi:TPA: hypothetical protein HH295_21200 [Xanthomonas vasicola pv. zeae]|uniref:Uncharacterized protein n=1 Tax=Xanthomonas hortorum pv. vitians TaxID=83224 RepID=A0AAW8ZL47_9XANT|nr:MULTISPECIES: hypothetical protein [Xanthomonas]MBV6748602.1 hypothetical protein [Xanthomonas vasicola pv. vasculorum NCPPB 890]MBV6894279.1 hypothetical protein [Xanthomonas vasicola pv. vasculorum]MCE4301580.1 hypothetical protein [Xanthomonas hortorum pv. vitians]MCE4552511.1 hypothetical protein [Xanthomonas hortorum pv. vitians]MDO6950161.1 hypothetical protein [Xanthomonas vasicola]